jgi:hypothetical protein
MYAAQNCAEVDTIPRTWTGKYIYGLFGKESREFTLASHSAGVLADH